MQIKSRQTHQQSPNKALHPTVYSPLVPRFLSAAGELGRSTVARSLAGCAILNEMKSKLLLFLLLPCFSSTGCTQKWEPSPKRQPDLYLVPNGYAGWLHVEFGVKDAPPLPSRWGYRVYKFSRSGKIRTSSPLLFGWAKDKIYYTTPKGWKELGISADGGKGMVWGEHLSGSANPVITKFDANGKKTEIPVPATEDTFIGTWKQFYHRKTEAPRSKEEEAALKDD